MRLSLPSFLTRGRLAVEDRQSVESEVRPADIKRRDPEVLAPGETETDLVDLVKARYKEAAGGAEEHLREAVKCVAFERGNQWVEWLRGSDQLESIIDPGDVDRTYLTINLIRPLIVKNIARVLSAHPGVVVRPHTGDPVNVQAAREGRLVVEHVTNDQHEQHLLLQLVYWAIVVGGAYRKLYWDDRKRVPMPVPQPGGGVHIIPKAPIGDLRQCVRSRFHIHRDPKAQTWDDAGWVIDAQVMPLRSIQERWPERGLLVEPERGLGTWSGWEVRLADMDADGGGGMGTGDRARKGAHSALVLEMWERPSARYPRGRVIWVAGNRIMAADDLTDYDEDIPIVPLEWHQSLGSPNPRGLVADLLQPQAQYNRILSRNIDRFNADFPTVLIPKGAEVGADAFGDAATWSHRTLGTSPRNYRKIYHNAGLQPQFMMPPPVTENWLNVAELLWARMQDIAGVHEVSGGRLPAADMAAAAIDLLQQSDTTQMTVFLTSLDHHNLRSRQWWLWFYGRNAREPRLWTLDSRERDS